MISWITEMYHQLFLFPAKERERLLRVLSLRIRAGMSLSEVFLSLSAIGTKNYKRIAEMSLSSQRRTGFYTSDWTDSPMWPRRDAMLLHLGEKHDAIADVADVLRSRMEDRLSFFSQVVSPNMMWVGALLAMVATVLYLMTQLDLIMRFMSEEPDFVFIGEFLQDYGILLLGALLAIIIGHRMASGRLSGEMRLLLRRVGVFSVVDRKFGMDVLRLWEILFNLGVGPVDSILAAMELYDRQPQRRAALNESLLRINNGISFPQAITGTCLPDSYGNFLASMSPQGDLEECSNAFPIVAQMLEDDAEGALSEMKWALQFTVVIPMLAIVFAILPLVTGAGLKM